METEDRSLPLGQLKNVGLRTKWKHEEYDFSAWLAEPANLQLLSDEIGISLVNAQKEAGVGRYSADILAEEEGTDRKVLIENQFNASNHDHLGKLVTYAAGLDAAIVIWITEQVREEHEQAIVWLNEHTDEQLNFFVIQMELWQIGDSAVAPKFNVVAKPNDWAKIVRQSARSGQRTISEYNLLQQKFWEGLIEADRSTRLLGTVKARPQHWYNVSLGSSNGHIALTVNKADSTMGCEIYVPRDQNKQVFDWLLAHNTDIEAKVGQPLEWMRLDERTASRVKLTITGAIEDEQEWPNYYEQLLQAVRVFKQTFPRYLKQRAS